MVTGSACSRYAFHAASSPSRLVWLYGRPASTVGWVSIARYSRIAVDVGGADVDEGAPALEPRGAACNRFSVPVTLAAKYVLPWRPVGRACGTVKYPGDRLDRALEACEIGQIAYDWLNWKMREMRDRRLWPHEDKRLLRPRRSAPPPGVRRETRSLRLQERPSRLVRPTASGRHPEHTQAVPGYAPR